MPVSRILTNGQVEVFNEKTGEVRVVNPSDLGKISPNLISSYVKKRAEVEKEFENKSEKSTTASLAQLNTLIKNQDPTTGGNPKSTAWRYIHSLEKVAKKRGIDMGTLWSVYDSLPNPQQQQAGSGQLGQFVNALKSRF